MLNKRPRSALILSAAAVLAFTLTSAILNLGLPYLVTGDIRTVIDDPARLRSPADILALVAILLITLVALIAIGAYWLHRFFGPAYFGMRGLGRWALFGALLALLIKLPGWLIPPNWWLARYILLFLGVFAAFFAARWIVPIKHS